MLGYCLIKPHPFLNKTKILNKITRSTVRNLLHDGKKNKSKENVSPGERWKIKTGKQLFFQLHYLLCATRYTLHLLSALFNYFCTYWNSMPPGRRTWCTAWASRMNGKRKPHGSQRDVLWVRRETLWLGCDYKTYRGAWQAHRLITSPSSTAQAYV